MKKTHWLTLLAALALLASLLAGPAAVSAGGPIGSPFPISNQSAEEKDPAIAYNSQAQEYLTVWWNDRSVNDDVYAQRVSKNGTLAGPWFAVAWGTISEYRYPDVAYNSTSNEYLVVYEADSTVIDGQRVSATGGLVGGAFPILLGTPGITITRFAVAYASTADRYLLVYTIFDGTGYSIKALALQPGGSADGSVFDLVTYTTLSLGAPDLAYNHRRNEFLVAWHVAGDIYARRVKMQGGAGTLGNAFAISTAGNDEFNPAVAAVPVLPDGQYLVVWTGGPSLLDGDIQARLVAGDGTPGASFPIADGPEHQMSPAVAGSESAGHYLATWTQVRKAIPGLPAIRGRAIATDGIQDAERALDHGPLNSDAAVAVASGPLSDFLVAYENPGNGTDIYGRRWGNAAPTASFTVNPPMGPPGTVFHFDASGSSDPEDPVTALQVRWDWENNGSYDTAWSTTKTADHSFAAAGVYTVCLQVQDTEGATGSATHPVTVTGQMPHVVFLPLILRQYP